MDTTTSDNEQQTSETTSDNEQQTTNVESTVAVATESTTKRKKCKTKKYKTMRERDAEIFKKDLLGTILQFFHADNPVNFINFYFRPAMLVSMIFSLYYGGWEPWMPVVVLTVLFPFN